MNIVGDLSRQVRWLQKVTFAVAGVQVFSVFPGSAGGIVSDTVKRLVVGFKSVTEHIWRVIGQFIQIDFRGYEDELTFSMLVLLPYVMHLKGVKFESPVMDENKILSVLNVLSFLFVNYVFFNREYDYSDLIYQVRLRSSLAAAPFLFIFSIALFLSLKNDIEYRFYIKFSLIYVLSTFFMVCLFYIIQDFDYFLEFRSPVVFLVASFLSNLAYFFAVACRVDGYYPLLFCCVCYLFYFCMDKILQWAPAIDRCLSSLGA
ncbi:hypothetical protein J5N58_03050 [Rhizobium cremeum]|uniref:hypothetical protein n=1 Tax=Rhizobium cremeum TaxID=2813827 RepID=UPI001FD444B8|nr:hypothetical protein [Rhizobium cremeum]MCJ7993587.1 hypothetical protein [Rhizobium cremeum]MCJ7998644.1 hypothetical protein [Rhizobium cremeum]